MPDRPSDLYDLADLAAADRAQSILDDVARAEWDRDLELKRRVEAGHKAAEREREVARLDEQQRRSETSRRSRTGRVKGGPEVIRVAVRRLWRQRGSLPIRCEGVVAEYLYDDRHCAEVVEELRARRVNIEAFTAHSMKSVGFVWVTDNTKRGKAKGGEVIARDRFTRIARRERRRLAAEEARPKAPAAP